jgi:4-hydroxybenzoate polyprenyltransferase
VTTLSAALAIILGRETGGVSGDTLALVMASVFGSQVFTGATNDLADQTRDAILQPRKPLPANDLSASAALWIASAGLALQILTSARLGSAYLFLGLAATGSALAYNLWLSRTPLSFVPYLVSFGILPVWVAVGVGVPVERVLPAVVLVIPFATAAHLANTLRDFDLDRQLGSQCLAQVLGRRVTHWLAVGLAAGVGVGVALTFILADAVPPSSVVLGVMGLLFVLPGARDANRLWPGMLGAAVAWTIAWGLASGPVS